MGWFPASKDKGNEELCALSNFSRRSSQMGSHVSSRTLAQSCGWRFQEKVSSKHPNLDQQTRHLPENVGRGDSSGITTIKEKRAQSVIAVVENQQKASTEPIICNGRADPVRPSVFLLYIFHFPSAPKGKCAAWAWTTAALVRISVRSPARGGDEGGAERCVWRKKKRRREEREKSKDESFMAMCHGTKDIPHFIQKKSLNIYIGKLSPGYFLPAVYDTSI